MLIKRYKFFSYKPKCKKYEWTEDSWGRKHGDFIIYHPPAINSGDYEQSSIKSKKIYKKGKLKQEIKL